MTFENIKDIKAMIAKMVADKIDGGSVVNMHWTVTDVLNEFDDIEGSDRDFYLITARYYVYEQVKSCVKKYDTTDTPSTAQIVLDGFEHLQKAYPIERGEVRQLVPVNQMSDAELESRACELDDMAKGCTDHAQEIRTFISSRQQTA
jgi:hypothetical protein